MKTLRSWIVFPLLIATLACTLPLVWGPAENPAPTSRPPQEIGPTLAGTELPDQDPDPTSQPLEGPTRPESTQVAPTPSSTLAPTSRPTPEPLRYELQSGSPAAVPNFAHPEFACNWLGLGGQIFSFSGVPEKGLVLEVGGELVGVETKLLGVTGGTELYGEGGFEFTLAQNPVASNQTLWIQIFDLAGNPLSEKYYFDTFEDCERNLILINFIGIPPAAFQRYFPVIIRN